LHEPLFIGRPIVETPTSGESSCGMKAATLTGKRGARAVDSRLLLAILALVWQSKAF
jgi:hypothetical protein